MKKFIIFLIFSTVIFNFSSIFGQASFNMTLTVDDPVAIINGVPRNMPVKPIIINGATMMPLRFITENIGYKVDWHQETKSILLTDGKNSITLQIDNSTAMVNGRGVKLIASPYLEEGNTMVPLRFIMENFGSSVYFDNNSKTITIAHTRTINSNTSNGYVIHRFVEQGFQISYPRLWQLVKGFGLDNDNIRMFFDPNTGVNSSVAALPPLIDGSFEEWLNLEFQLMERIFKIDSFEIIKQKIGADAAVVQYSYTLFDQKIMTTQFYMLGKNKRFVITISAPQNFMLDNSKGLLEITNSIFESFKEL